MRTSAARSRCAVVHVVTHSFSARGVDAHPSPLAERGDGHTPTLRVDTHPLQGGPTYTRTPQCLCCPSSTDLPGGRPAEDPGAPPLSAVRVSPSSQQPPGSGAAKSNKNSETTRQMENYWRQVLELQATNLSTWPVPRNSENAAKRPKNRVHEEIDDVHFEPEKRAQQRRTHRRKEEELLHSQIHEHHEESEERKNQHVSLRARRITEKPTSYHRRIRTWDCSTTVVHAVPSLLTHVRPCTPDFGPGTSALRSYRVEVGCAAAPLLSTASEQVPRMVRADSTGAGHPSQADLRRTAQPEQSQVWTSSA